ncbi:MAG: hypothetical protein ABIT01_18365 [Thermoanaerobaculia bacterium]
MHRKTKAAIDGEQIRSAAFQLKHDLGKPVRWNAPETREPELEALRARLRRDLGTTRERDGRVWSAVEVFEEWRKQESRFLATPQFAPDLAALAAAMGRVRSLMGRIETLDGGGLVELDDASRGIAERCQALYRLAVAAVAAGTRP